MASFAVVVLGGMGLLGLRLALLWRRTRGLPELLLALFFVMSGPTGFLPITLLNQGALSWLGADEAVRGAGFLSLNVALGVMALFTWQVFRPTERWAAFVAPAMGLTLVGLWLNSAISIGFPAVQAPTLAWMIGTLVRAAILVWSGYEAIRYWGQMRRRVRTGLADALIANRFLLWGVWVGACALVLVVGVAHVMFGLDDGVRLAINSTMGVVCIASVALTFFPPAPYARFVRGATA